MKVKSVFLSLWNVVDPIYYSCTRLNVLKAWSTDNIFRVRLTRYKGRPVMLSDGTRIEKDDTLLKIHLHNVVLLREVFPIANEIKKAKMIYDKVRRSMPGLVQYIQQHEKSSEIKGVIGITILSKGSERLGFDVMPITNLWYRLLKWITFLPIYSFILSQSPQRLIKRSPVYLFISKETLFNRYGRL